MVQSKDQNKSPETDSNEPEINGLLNTEFKITILKMLNKVKENKDKQNQENDHKQNENINKEIETITKNK